MTLDRVAGMLVAAGLLARALMIRPARNVSVADRLAALPPTAPSAGPITIHWNEHLIPYVEAASKDDLAVGLGIVHAHLRGAQMEIMRRLALGRVAEMVGPLGLGLDRALLLLDFPRAVPAIIEALSPATRAWAEGFLRGVNHVQAQAPWPHECRLLGIRREPWTLADLFATARLAATDVNWLVWGRLLRARAAMPRAEWLALWPRLLAGGMPTPQAPFVAPFARAGSNAAAVGGGRTASGSALLAADPHLSIALPNIWLAAGMSCPGLRVVGLMPTGFPVVAIGRNEDLAWAGTSLHAAASDLFDAASLPMTEQTRTVRVRWTGNRRLTLRETALGPVVSDGLLFRNPEPLAMRWVGHGVSDEMGAMLGVMQARDRAGFEAALQPFAIPGQNMIYATRDGHVGHVLALHAPRRPGPPDDLVQPPTAVAAWHSLATLGDFPARHDPADGVVASANDAPPASAVPAGFLFSPPDRVERLHDLLGGEARVDADMMARTQTDVQGRVATARALAARRPEHAAAAALREWDGRYTADSRGALVFEATMGALLPTLPDQPRLAAMGAVWQGRLMTAQQALELPDATLGPLLEAAMTAAMTMLSRHGSWGAVHRMRLRHYFGAAPLLGRRYRYGEYASPGGNDTLDKTGHPSVRGPHAVSYGASARFVTDLAEPDANRVVLLGGQDGWIGSVAFLDQATLWQRGELLPLPLRPETARLWPHHSVLPPG